MTTTTDSPKEDSYQRRSTDEIYLMRHSYKPDQKIGEKDDETYQGLSRKGVEYARGKPVDDILIKIKKAKAKTVMFLGGVSDEIRTASTVRVCGEELKRRLAGDKEYLVVTERDIAEGKYGMKQVYDKPGSHREMIEENIKYIINQNPDKKIIIDVPMLVEELSSRSNEKQGRIGWMTENGEHTPYAMKLLKKAGGDMNKALEYWISHNNPEIEGLKGPDPMKVAKRYAQGINNLEKTLHHYVGDRPLITGLVGHNFESDTFLTYLAGDGKITLDNFKRVSDNKGLIKETESAQIFIREGITLLKYRGKQIKTKPLEQLVMIFGILSLLLSFVSMINITGSAVGAEEVNIFSSIFIALAIIFAILFFQLRKHHHKK